jgi:hypothetical protein
MVLSLRKKIIVLQFWSWYYTGAVRSLIKTWRDFIIFVREYYSIPLLLKTLFYPWRRDITKYGRGFSIKKFLETLSFNLISRGLGFFARIFIIILGFICLVGVIVLGALALIIWLILPAVLLFFIIMGLMLLAG